MNIEIANRLQRLRKEKGYSQEQLAEALGLSRQAVSKWERAEASPDTDNLICLARLYGISLDELLATSDTTEEIKKSTEQKEEEKKDKVNISFSGIDVEDKNGDKVHVGFDGIKVGDHLKIDKKSKLTKGQKTVLDAIEAFICVGTVVAYIIMGSVWGLWHPGWIIFLFIPVLISIVEAIVFKKFTEFCYPVLVTAVYLILGFQFDGWHPYWFLFITIPLYYILFDPIDKVIHKDDEDINIGEILKENKSVVIDSDDAHIEIKANND